MSTANVPNMLPLPESLPPVAYMPPQMQVGDPAPTVTPGDIWRIVKQRKWTVITTFVVLYALVVAATLIIWRFFPAYPATAFLQLQPPRDPMKVSDEMVSGDEMRLIMQTEAQKIAQPGIFSEVLALPEVKETNFYKWYGGKFDACLDDLKELVDVTPIPDSQLIKISIDLQHKSEATLIINRILDQYLKRFARAEGEGKQRMLDDFKKAREDLTKQLTQKKDALVDFRDLTNIPGVQSANTVEIVAITKLTEALTTLRAQEAELRVNKDALETFKNPDTVPISAEQRLILETDPIIRYNRAQVDNIDIQIQMMLTAGRFGENHREVMALKVQRDQFYQKEIQRREEVIDDLRERQMDSINTDLATVTALLGQYTDELAAAESKQRDLDDAMVKYKTMQDEYERILLSLVDIEKRVQEAQLSVDSSPRQPRLNIWQRPLDAAKPSRPSFLLYLGGGFALALLGALGMAFLREFTDSAVRTPLDVRNSGNMMVLGTIPLIDYEEAEVEEIEHATRQAPQSLVAEAFRQVKAQLMFSGPTESQRVLLVTSPGPGDGNSACAINLAVTFAQSNQRVLLIDCNFRRPALRAAFRNTKTEGLSNVLIGQKKLADVISHTELPNLDVVTTGPAPSSPAELLGSNYMAELIRDAAQTYDRIILDGPPALLVSDSLVLATLADGVLMVARAVNNSKGELRRARDQVQRVGGRIIGCILNGVQYRAGGYFKRQFREFYDYTSDEAVPQELLGGPTEEKPEGKTRGKKARPRPPVDEGDADDEK